MSTSYDVVDNSFLNKITDDHLLTIPEEELQRMIDNFRTSASVKFKQCKKLQNTNDTQRVYEQTLTDEEVEILANLMVLEWLRQRINSIELLKQTMSTKDYQMYSQANHLKSLIDLKKMTETEVSRMIVSYTYYNNDLSLLRRDNR